jgi:hypothetical protein
VRDRFRERLVERVGAVDDGAVAAAALRELGEARIDEGGPPDVPAAGPPFLADLPECVVVEQDVRDVHPALHGGRELARVLPEAAVAGDRDHVAAGERRVGLLRRGPRSGRGGEREPDRAEAAGHQHGLPFRLEVPPEGGGGVPTSTGTTASSGTSRVIASTAVA